MSTSASIGDRYLIEDAAERRGGSSRVVRGFDKATFKQVAIKLMQKSGGADLPIDEFFRRETETLQALSHRGIVTLIDSGVTDDGSHYFLVFDWFDRSLQEVIESQRPIEWEEFSNRYLLPVARALAYAHGREVEHRDVKPQNVLITQDGSPMLADFGISKMRDVLSAGGARSETVVDFRSGIYSPPEPYPAPYVRDVFAIGVTSIHALSEADVADYGALREAVQKVAAPPSVRRLLERCVSDAPDSRPANMILLLHELESVLSAPEYGGSSSERVARVALTSRAVREILRSTSLGVDPEIRANALQVLSQDLAKECWLGYYPTPEGIDPTRMIVIGASIEFIVAIDQSRSQFRVIQANHPAVDILEKKRKNLIVAPRDVRWGAGGASSAVLQGYDTIIESLESAIEEAGREESRDTNSLFDQWARLLEARIQKQRGTTARLQYTGVSVSGRRATFELAPDVDLSGVVEDLQYEIDRPFGKSGPSGTIDSVGTETITMVAERSWPSLASEGYLIPSLGSSAAGYSRQRQAIDDVRSRRAVRSELSELLENPEDSRPPSSMSVETWCNPSLDNGQRSAVEKSLGAEDFLIVKGPPGTGKTSFITELVQQKLRLEPRARVLIVSQTHVAVDNALQRITAEGVSNVVRLGRPDDARIDPSVRDLLLTNRLDVWAAGVKARADRWLRAHADANGISVDHLRAASLLRQLLSTMKEIEQIDAQSTSDEPQTYTTNLGASLDIGEDASALRQRRSSLERLSDRLENEARVAVGSDLTLGLKLTKSAVEDAINAILVGVPTPESLISLLEIQSDWLQRVGTDDGALGAFLRTVQVVAGTCLGFLSVPEVKRMQFDLCIIDEASKATATEALVPLTRARSWIMVGDPNQLPPLDEGLLHDEALRDQYDLSDRVISETLFDRLIAKAPTESIASLTRQYRMIRPIGDLISTCFYSGELRSPRVDGIPGLEVLGKPVLWLSTSQNPQRHEALPTGSSSPINRVEVDEIFHWLDTLQGAIDKGVVTPDGGSLLVLLVAPYRKQVEELYRRSTRRKYPSLKLEILSVDAVQGKEADICVFSVTRSNRQGRMGFIGSSYWRRINVALSRARSGLVITGDFAFAQANDGGLRRVAQYMEANIADCEIRDVQSNA